MITGKSRTRLAVAGAVLTVLGAVGLLLPPASLAGTRVTKLASAGGTQIPCEHGANGFVDIPDTLQGRIETGAQADHWGSGVWPPPGVGLDLEAGSVRGRMSGWAHLYGATHAGDLVWMDWSQDSGNNWGQCGPFRIDFDGQSKTSASKGTSP